MHKKNKTGFSLIELLVVIAIIGVLVAIGFLGYQKYINVSQKTVLAKNMAEIDRALSTDLVAFNSDVSGLSSLLNGLQISRDTSCEDIATQLVFNLNNKRNNPFDSSRPVAGYGNAIVGGTTIPKGTIVVFCKNPSTKISSSNFVIFECADDEADNLAIGGDDYTMGSCPQPNAPSLGTPFINPTQVFNY